MIQSRKDLNFYIAEDCKRNGQNRGILHYMWNLLRGQEQAHAFRYIKAMRHLEYHMNNTGLIHAIAKVFYKIKVGRLGLRYSIEIQPNSCGYGLRIVHLSSGGVLLNAKKIGNYCGFNAGSLVGNKDSQENRPEIGDYVAFGPGAKAFGKITIGDNLFVASNAVVVKDIPSNVIVGGLPAKIIKEKQNGKTK